MQLTIIQAITSFLLMHSGPEEFLGSLSPPPESELSSTAHSPSPMGSDHRSDGGLLSPTSESSSLGEQEGEERQTSSRVVTDSGGMLDDSPKLLAIHRMLSEGALRDSAILSSSNTVNSENVSLLMSGFVPYDIHSHNESVLAFLRANKSAT